MLNIVEKNTEELITLKHGPNVFHDALKHVKEGDVRFHVNDPEGKVPDYDLQYIDNMMLFPEQARAIITKMTENGRCYGYFYDYDENETENMYIEFLDQFDKIEVEVIDEYSIVVVRMALLYRTIPIYALDERIKCFVDEPDRINIVDSFDTDQDKKTLRMVASPFELGFTKQNWSRLSTVSAFQNLFFWQIYLTGKKTPIKYVEVVLTKIAGVGAILAVLSQIEKACEERNYKVFLRPGCTRYPEDLLCRYFRINPKPDDATEENTMSLEDLTEFKTSWFCSRFPANFDESILDEKFAEEMNEYAEAIIGGRKILGVLARGTDYVTMKLGADRRHATPDQMISVIQEWMDEGKYEKIFLATEDKDNYDKIRAAFPGKVIAVSQERHSISEMKKHNSNLIYEFEHKLNTGKAYIDALEDTTVNYFYALYILSKCDAFLCSGQCNGWDTVNSLNNGKFERKRKLFVSVEGDPVIEKWKEIRPITAGMFARGAYPVNNAFFMTYRFDLKEKVDPDAIKTAWEKTLKVYPYMSYAVGVRGGRMALFENELPFVIKETGEVVAPYERSGNFHTVTFCYMSNTLWVYADHITVDGTGFQYVMETFFYHYYCELDGCEYPVPEGVLTEKDGEAKGQDVDAYLMADPVDPKALMKKASGGETFVAKETISDELLIKRENCRGYCISVPSKEMMAYAKSVKGSPMSVLSVFLAKAMERLNPDNKLPISMIIPINVRKTMGNTYSLLHQVVHMPYSFTPDELASDSDDTLNNKMRAHLNGFSQDQNIRMMCGVYRGICEGYAKAFQAGGLEEIVLEQRSKHKGSLEISYLGTFKTGDYGNRIRMTAFHAMPEKGFMLQVAEVGDYFYIDWYQGFFGDMYAKAMRDLMIEAGMENTSIERVE